MKVFEDLIEELRDENLLEDTVIDLTRSAKNGTNESADQDGFALESVDPEVEGVGGNPESPSQQPEPEPAQHDFYRKRAIDEISSLQMVDHVLSSIEREHMKMVPASYDDLEAKKALHKFLQVQGDSTTPEYAEAEFQLMRETESWSSALSDRDRNISVANLRRFCENSRPVLSSQALIALARFYRNSAFSEVTRAKFDFVMTRLFSREVEGEKRKVLFSRGEMIGHIKTLYANWASVALYSTDDVSLKSRAIVAGFEDRVAEAESALTFDQLIQNDFFKKVHGFKEATGEVFFTPEIVAAAIDCNTKVGNKFVDLIRLERERSNLESIEQKYGYEYDQVISEAAGKTLHLVELLKNLPESEDADDAVDARHEAAPDSAPTTSDVKKEKAPLFTFELFAVNKWLLLATIVVVLASTGLYFWSNQPSQENAAAESAQDVNLDGSVLKEYVRTGRATPETFYAITLPVWEELEEDKKREILHQALEFANKKGLKNVQFINVRGRPVGSASQTRIEILKP